MCYLYLYILYTLVFSFPSVWETKYSRFVCVYIYNLNTGYFVSSVLLLAFRFVTAFCWKLAIRLLVATNMRERKYYNPEHTNFCYFQLVFLPRWDTSLISPIVEVRRAFICKQYLTTTIGRFNCVIFVKWLYFCQISTPAINTYSAFYQFDGNFRSL